MTGSKGQVITVVVTLALATACAASAPPASAPAPTTATGAGSMATGFDSAANPYTAADVRFMTRMIPHHGQALTISRWAATHDASHTIRTLAERIINAQQDEITIMQRWLRDRGKPVPQPGDPMHAMGEGGAHHMHGAHGMPGMLSDDQLKQLDRARGKDFDRLFLSFMIQHHRGAVQMVRELLASEGAALDDAVFKLASDINVDQTTEIDRMQKMLVEQLLTP